MSLCWSKKFNCTCREKNHVLFHWVLLMSPGQLMQIWRLYKKRKFMTIRMSTRTELCQIRERVSQDLRYWTKLFWKEKGNPGEEETDENSNDITSRSHMAWRIDNNWESSSKKKETRISESRNCCSMQKIVFPNMHTGNRCSKITRAQVCEAKFVCIDIAGERQNSV